MIYQPLPEKRCYVCLEWYPASLEYFHMRKSSKQKLHNLCILCNRNRAKRWSIANPEKRKEGRKRYDQRHPEKKKARTKKWKRTEYGKLACRVIESHRNAKKKQSVGYYTEDDVLNQYKRQKGRCYYCGQKAGQNYHIDHVIPLSRGGSNSADNIVIACPDCNLRKNAKLPHEWPEGGRLL